MIAEKDNQMTWGEHLEVLRQMLFRILKLTGVFMIMVFCCKDITWSLLLAPSRWDFCTYRWIESLMQGVGMTDFSFEEYHVDLITTELSSQFMLHISTSVYLGLLCGSPYILYELFRFVSPALYANERKYSVRVTMIIYALFVAGVLMTYFILFPISFRFLGTYSVSQSVHSTITLDSYVDTFVSLTLMMGLVFQLPVLSYVLARIGILSYNLLTAYRRHAFVLILILAAIITPPDVMTLFVVSVPLYLLYEISIRIVKHAESRSDITQ